MFIVRWRKKCITKKSDLYCWHGSKRCLHYWFYAQEKRTVKSFFNTWGSKSQKRGRWPLDYPTHPRQQFLPWAEEPTTILAAKISGMKLNLASCRITTVISCCLDKIATKLCHNASKWSLKWPVNIVEERRIIPEFKLEENWAKIIGLFVKILAAKDGGIISKLYILHLIKMTQDSAFSDVSFSIF